MPRSLLLRLAAHWSDGIGLCISDGPASGRMMGYACRNHASGRGFIGRWIDRRFLNYAGWEGVRQRRLCLEKLIAKTIDSIPGDVHLLDIAGGTADYVLSVLTRPQTKTVSALCLDLAAEAIAEGQRNAEQAGLTHAEFRIGDALNADALLHLSPRPGVVICSGLYELLTDDSVVEESMCIVSRMLESGGCFIVSHQTTRPRSFFTSQAATMQMRSAHVVMEMLTAAGFAIEQQLSAADLYAIFLARRK